jgi:hypothetical protein
MRSLWVPALFVLLSSCGGSSTTPSTPSDAAASDSVATDGPAVEDAQVEPEDGLVAEDAVPTPTDSGEGDAACTNCGSLVGTVGRNDGTKPNAGGKGHVYIAVFTGNPILDRNNAKVVARTLIENVDLSVNGTTVPYRVDGIPAGPTEYQVIAFLDDNKTATAANPAPDKGDLVTMTTLPPSGVKVKVPTPTDVKLDLKMNAALP